MVSLWVTEKCAVVTLLPIYVIIMIIVMVIVIALFPLSVFSPTLICLKQVEMSVCLSSQNNDDNNNNNNNDLIFFYYLHIGNTIWAIPVSIRKESSNGGFLDHGLLGSEDLALPHCHPHYDTSHVWLLAGHLWDLHDHSGQNLRGDLFPFFLFFRLHIPSHRHVCGLFHESLL